MSRASRLLSLLPDRLLFPWVPLWLGFPHDMQEKYLWVVASAKVFWHLWGLVAVIFSSTRTLYTVSQLGSVWGLDSWLGLEVQTGSAEGRVVVRGVSRGGNEFPVMRRDQVSTCRGHWRGVRCSLSPFRP